MIRKELLKIIEANKLLELFLKDYPFQAAKISLIPEGLENASYSISTNVGDFVLRIYKPDKSIPRIKAETDFMNFLTSQSIPVPEIYKNNKGELVTILTANTYLVSAIVMHKIQGSAPEEYSETIVQEIGKWMGKLHVISSQYSNSAIPQCGDVVSEYFTNNNEVKFEQIINKKVKLFLTDAKNFSWDIKYLPKGIIHSDFHRNNLLFRDDKIVGILDFDDIQRSALVTDLGVMIYNLLYGYKYKDTKLELISILINSYSKERKINKAELHELINATHLRNYGLAAFFSTLENDVNNFDIEEYYVIRNLIDETLPGIISTF